MALPPGHRTQWREVPVTSLDRTVADCLTGFGPLEGLLIADSALRLGAEKRRQDALTEEDWGVLRVTTADLRRPKELVDRVCRRLPRGVVARLVPIPALTPW